MCGSRFYPLFHFFFRILPSTPLQIDETAVLSLINFASRLLYVLAGPGRSIEAHAIDVVFVHHIMDEIRPLSTSSRFGPSNCTLTRYGRFRVDVLHVNISVTVAYW